MKHIRLLILFLILGITTLSAQKSPKREFRGAWIQTVFQSEYAKMTPEEMKAFLDDYVIGQDEAKKVLSVAARKPMPGTCRK